MRNELYKTLRLLKYMERDCDVQVCDLVCLWGRRQRETGGLEGIVVMYWHIQRGDIFWRWKTWRDVFVRCKAAAAVNVQTMNDVRAGVGVGGDRGVRRCLALRDTSASSNVISTASVSRQPHARALRKTAMPK